MRPRLIWTLLVLAACNIGLDPIKGNPDPTGDDSAEPQEFGSLVVSHTTLDFGDVEMGSSTVSDITLRNEGDAPIALQTVELRWGQGFSITSTAVEAIESGGEVVVSVEFEPITNGAHEDTLIIETNLADAPHVEVGLLGSGTEPGSGDDSGGGNTDPSVTVSQQNINFGTVNIGTVGEAEIEIENVGTADVTIVQISSSDSTFSWARDFTLPYILRAGTSRTATLTYTPTSETTNRGTITVESSDAVRPEIDIAVQGEGFQQCSICAPLMDVYTSSGSTTELSGLISFNCQPANGTITIQNIGDETLNINGMNVVNDALQGSFSLSGWSGSIQLAPWDTTTVTVSYTASTTVLLEGRYELFGSVFNVLNITSNDPSNSLYEVALSASATGC